MRQISFNDFHRKNGMKRKEMIFVDNNGIEASQSRGREMNGGQFSTRNHKFSLFSSLLNWNQCRCDTKKSNGRREVFVDAD